VSAGVGFPPSIREDGTALDAGRASKRKRSIGSAVTLSAALERFRADHEYYPQALDREHLASDLVPKYLRAVPSDVYGQPFVVTMNGTAPAVISLGRGGFGVQQNVVRGEPWRVSP
jgi:hypothetical protein